MERSEIIIAQTYFQSEEKCSGQNEVFPVLATPIQTILVPLADRLGPNQSSEISFKSNNFTGSITVKGYRLILIKSELLFLNILQKSQSAASLRNDPPSIKIGIARLN